MQRESLNLTFCVLFVLIITIAVSPAFAQTTKTAQEKADDRLKKNCEKIQQITPNSIPKYCAKYGIEAPVQLPTNPIAYQKQQYNQKINELTKKFSEDVAPKRAEMGETEYMRQYDDLQKQIESLELKLTALDSGRTVPQEEITNNCDSGKVLDAFGNCVTPQQKKITQMKNQKGVPSSLIDDNENLKAEITQLKSKVGDLEKKMSDLELLIKQLQISINKLLS